MTSENARLFDDLKFQLDLMHLLDGCEEPAPSPGPGASAAAVIAADMTHASPSVQ